MDEFISENKVLSFRELDELIVDIDISCEDVVDIIISSLSFACKCIKENNLDVVKYDFIFDKYHYYKNVLFKYMGTDFNYDPSEEEIISVFNEYYDTYENLALEDNLLNRLKRNCNRNINSLSYSDIYEEYKDYVIDLIIRERLFKNPNCDNALKIGSFLSRIQTFVVDDKNKRLIRKAILDYKPNSENNLGNYISIGNIEKIDTILREEFSDTNILRSGVKVITVLKAIEKCGCKFEISKNLKGFYKNILVYRYGVTASYEIIRRLYQGTDEEQANVIRYATEKANLYKDRLA